jgi:ferric-dicitrate binding protein FerR (iron transport regulator)
MSREGNGGGTAASEERWTRLLMSALDGELSETEREAFEDVLEHDSELRAEWDRLRRVKEVTDSMKLREPPEEVWGSYWSGVYRRTERGIAWILVSVGAIVLISWGLVHWVQDVLADTSVPGLIRWASVGLVVGLVILFVSVVREKLHIRKSDPYKDVIR